MAAERTYYSRPPSVPTRSVHPNLPRPDDRVIEKIEKEFGTEIYDSEMFIECKEFSKELGHRMIEEGLEFDNLFDKKEGTLQLNGFRRVLKKAFNVLARKDIKFTTNGKKLFVLDIGDNHLLETLMADKIPFAYDNGVLAIC